MPDKVPIVWPRVSLLTMSGITLFPRFRKIVEVSNPIVMELLRRKVTLYQPYIGTVLMKVDGEEEDIVKSLYEVHHLGPFAQISEVMDLSGKLRIMLVVHHSIRITGQVVEVLFSTTD